MTPRIRLYADPVDWAKYISVKEVRQGEGNIAGVDDLFSTAWTSTSPFRISSRPRCGSDDGIRGLEQLISLRLERRVLERQYELLSEELRTTSQRVNLFEKSRYRKRRKTSASSIF